MHKKGHRRPVDHLYRHGASKKMVKEFQERYGSEKGKYVYGALVGKMKKKYGY